MNKDNIFRTSSFYMAEGDVLHIIIKDETGAVPLILLQGEVTEEAPSSPTIDDATNIASNSFSANWLFTENATGYYLDVSTDALFEYMVSGYDNRDVGNVATLSVTGLATGTPYYYRVRAYNDVGTSGNSGTATLTTTAVATLVDLDGNEYTTVRIGNQEWIVENFRCTKYADGSAIANITDDNEWVNGVEGTNMTKIDYGALYNWYAATYSEGGASIAPAGWHVPTKTELEVFGSGIAVGNSLKTVGSTYWDDPNGGTNSTGFSARGAGYRSGTGADFLDTKVTTGFWSDTNYSTDVAYEGNIFDSGYYQVGFQFKRAGKSIRLIKDDSTDPGTMTDYDGNTYATVKIGSQVWMATNLKVEHYNDGTAIPRVTADASWIALTTDAFCYYNNDTNTFDGAYCWYDNNIANKADYGALYNWYAVDVDPSDSKDLAYLERSGVQEAGWRVPVEADFTELVAYLGGDSVAGGKLKEVGFVHWTTPNTGATNEYGFNGFGAGYRSTDGSFEASINQFLILYGADSNLQLLYLWANATISGSPIPVYGLSVRLVRDFPSGDVTCDSTDITSDSLVVTCDME